MVQTKTFNVSWETIHFLNSKNNDFLLSEVISDQATVGQLEARSLNERPKTLLSAAEG